MYSWFFISIFRWQCHKFGYHNFIFIPHLNHIKGFLPYLVDYSILICNLSSLIYLYYLYLYFNMISEKMSNKTSLPTKKIKTIINLFCNRNPIKSIKTNTTAIPQSKASKHCLFQIQNAQLNHSASSRIQPPIRIKTIATHHNQIIGSSCNTPTLINGVTPIIRIWNITSPS